MIICSCYICLCYRSSQLIKMLRHFWTMHMHTICLNQSITDVNPAHECVTFSSYSLNHSQWKAFIVRCFNALQWTVMDLKTKIDLVRCYYANGNSPTLAIRQFKRERNSIRYPCTCSAISKLISKFEETRSVLNERHSRSSLEEELQETVESALHDA